MTRDYQKGVVKYPLVNGSEWVVNSCQVTLGFGWFGLVGGRCIDPCLRAFDHDHVSFTVVSTLITVYDDRCPPAID